MFYKPGYIVHAWCKQILHSPLKNKYMVQFLFSWVSVDWAFSPWYYDFIIFHLISHQWTDLRLLHSIYPFGEKYYWEKNWSLTVCIPKIHKIQKKRLNLVIFSPQLNFVKKKKKERKTYHDLYKISYLSIARNVWHLFPNTVWNSLLYSKFQYLYKLQYSRICATKRENNQISITERSCELAAL